MPRERGAARLRDPASSSALSSNRPADLAASPGDAVDEPRRLSDRPAQSRASPACSSRATRRTKRSCCSRRRPRRWSPRSTGREVILDLLGAGALVGKLSALDGRLRSATVTALGPVEVLALPVGVFAEFRHRHPDATRRLLEDGVARLRARDRRQLELGTSDAIGRLCARLLDLAERCERADPDGSVVVRSPLTQAELAAWTGLSRDAVVCSLRALRKRG